MGDLMRGSVETVAVARDVASSSQSKPTAALDMTSRYPKPNPDCLPLLNGSGGSRKPPPPAAPAQRSSKDEIAAAVATGTDSSRLAAHLASTWLEPKQRARTPPPTAPSSPAAVAATRSPARDQGHHASDFAGPSSPSYLGDGASGSAGPAGGEEMLLQWGHNKRVRGRRDAPAGGAAPLRRQPVAKIPRRSPAPDKLMPPPRLPSYTSGSNRRIDSTLPARGGDAHHSRGSLGYLRSAEELAGGKVAKAEKQRPDKQRADAAGPVTGLMVPDTKQLQQAGAHQHPGAALSTSSKPKLEIPRIYTTLSRKEKEEDFFAMKGTKLPVRPKKRPKTVEKALNFIRPGMWLTDVRRNRYMVRERKCAKKQKYLGLKGMERMESESD